MSGRGTRVGAEDEAEDEPDDGGFRISIEDMGLPVPAPAPAKKIEIMKTACVPTTVG